MMFVWKIPTLFLYEVFNILDLGSSGKTEEVTDKFLDKERDPQKYNPQKINDSRKVKIKKHTHRDKVFSTYGEEGRQTLFQELFKQRL